MKKTKQPIIKKWRGYIKMSKKFDFSGYATKIDLKCSDGRVIRKDAFKHNSGQTVPLVWQHLHNDPTNILGHALLENREDGVYTYCTFNDTESAKHAKMLVEHGDITALSIHANQLKQKGDSVIHGVIREVSLVLAGANPEALIDNLSIQHGDGRYETDETEAIIFTGQKISLTDLEHSDDSGEDKTVKDVLDTLNDEQKEVVYAMLAHALGEGKDKKDDEEEKDEDNKKMEHSDKGGNKMKKNVFDNKGDEDKKKTTLTHSQFQTILANAQKCGSLKEAVLSHAGTYGIDDIDFLFPDAKTITPVPDFIKREMGWVPGVISGTRHTPFSRIKSTAADITAEEARALGYVKGALKKDEVIKLLKRVTGPTTVYKKQKLDRDDIIDITDLDVVAWLKSEMRMMLDEELARAVLIGDGRASDSADKINEENIRPIHKDEDMYAHHVSLDSDVDTFDIVEAIIRARVHYKGSGNPALYTTPNILTDMLLLKDTTGRRLYNTESELASALRVSKIVEVPVMEGQTRETDDDVPVEMDLIGIIVNLKDYVMGADKGGQVSMFDDFDIDYNQYKYLIETRCSGALVHPKSALVIEKVKVIEEN
jgi:HK97 family phage prohead protease/HK97 family phage major capsid protein